VSSNDSRRLRPVPSEPAGAWADVLAAAGFPDEEVELLLFDDDPTARLPQWGLHLGPYDLTQDLEPCLTERQRAEVDRLEFDKHRIIVWVGTPRLPVEIIRALMRHEVRHAEQFAHDRTVYRLGIVIAISLGRVYSGSGAASIRRLIPHEEDANAAASRFVAPIGEAADARDGKFGALVTETTPLQPLDSLGRRALAFAALHPDAFVAEARDRGLDERFLLGKLDPAGPALFRELVADGELRHLRDEVAAAVPTSDAIGAEGEAGQAWEPVRERLAEAQRVAERIVGVAGAR
jgi:hypothetical protein